MIPTKNTSPNNFIRRVKWISFLSMSSFVFSAMIITFEALPADIQSFVPEGVRSFLALGMLFGSGFTSLIHKTISDDVNASSDNGDS